MRLTGIREGDIVEVNDGLPYHALVRERERGRLRIVMFGSRSVRTVKAGEVVGHWRRAGR